MRNRLSTSAMLAVSLAAAITPEVFSSRGHRERDKRTADDIAERAAKQAAKLARRAAQNKAEVSRQARGRR